MPVVWQANPFSNVISNLNQIFSRGSGYTKRRKCQTINTPYKIEPKFLIVFFTIVLLKNCTTRYRLNLNLHIRLHSLNCINLWNSLNIYRN